MAASFHHGVEIIEVKSRTRIISVVRSSVIGLVGTAPIHLLPEAQRKLNSLALILSDADKAYHLGADADSAGYTLSNSVNAVFAQGAGAIIAVNVFDPTQHRTLGAANASASDQSVTANRATVTFAAAHGLAPNDFVEVTGFTGALAVLNQSYVRVRSVPSTTTITFDVTTADIPVTTSTDGIVKKITFDPSLVTLGDIIGGVNAAGERYGMQVWRESRSKFGYVPRILIAPSYSTQEPVAVALTTIAAQLRGHCIIDAPAGLTYQEVLEGRGSTGTINFETSFERVIGAYPHVEVYNTAREAIELQPFSPFLAGVMAATDNREGYWVSPSNQEIKGIVGVECTISFDVMDVNSEANALNAAGVVTIVRDYGTGFLVWGNRSMAFPSNPDPENFISVRRTMDIVHDSLGYGLRPFLGRPMIPAQIDSALATINAFLRSRIAEGALIGASATFEPSDNNVSQLAQGKIVFALEHMPPPPMEQITIKSRMNIELLDALFENQ
jgi:uncharacterized protein